MPKSLLDPKTLSTHIDAVRALARSLLGDADAADDIAQDAAVIALESTQVIHAPRGWFTGVARNLSHRRIRERTRRRKREYAAAQPEAVRDGAELMHRATEQRRVLDHLLKLEDPYRDVLLLRFFEGLPPREIAKRRVAPVETIRTQIRRGIERLRERLESELRTDGRTWQQGLVLAAGVGAKVGRRAPVALLSKAALAASVLLAVGATAWWGASLLSSDAHIVPDDIHIAAEPLVTDTKGDGDDDGAVALRIPEWIPPPKRRDVHTQSSAEDTAPLTRTLAAPQTRRRPSTPTRPAEVPAAPEVEARPYVPPTTRISEPIRAAMRSTEGGMVLLPKSFVHFGSPESWAEDFAVAGQNRALEGVLWEAPTFRIEIEDTYIDKHEVTNAQYELYLRDVGKLERFRVGRNRYQQRRTMLGVIEELWGAEVVLRPVDQQRAVEQLYYVNAAVLIKAMPQLVVRTEPGDVDHAATLELMKAAELKSGLRLRFYSRPIPPSWNGMAPAADERDHPVRGLAYAEALAFAQWAGKHIPSEFTWEYAARGRTGWDWPWGADAINFAERVNGGYRRRRGDIPRTVPVHFLPAGRSQFGCFNMLGNVSEWTSSPLLQYPGRDVLLGRGPEQRVVRGGSAADTVAGAVRPMFRGWEDLRNLLKPASRAFKDSRAVPAPHPRQRRDWTGFRCAWFKDVGASLIETMGERFSLATNMPRALLDSRHWLALQSTHHAPSGVIVSEGKFVQGPSHGLAVQPLRVAVHVPRTRELHRTNHNYEMLSDANVVELQDLQSALVNRKLVLGLFHTDMVIQDRLSRIRPEVRRTWWGTKDRTGTFVITWDGSDAHLEHLVTRQRYKLTKSAANLREGGDRFTKAQPKVIIRAPHIARRLSGSAEIRIMVPYSAQVDSSHMLLDVTFRLDLNRPETDLGVRPLLSGGK